MTRSAGFPPELLEPIDYAGVAEGTGPNDQRYRALEELVLRLQTAGWFDECAVIGFNLIDWDLRVEPAEYNHRHVPMWIASRGIVEWYARYGALLALAPERAKRFSLARFFFGPRSYSDIVDIQYDLTGPALFSISRENPKDTLISGSIKIRINPSRARSLCEPLQPWLIRGGNLDVDMSRPSIEPLSTHLRTHTAEPIANADSVDVKAFLEKLDSEVTSYGSGAERLVGGETRQDPCMLLTNLAVQAAIAPDGVDKTGLAIVAGVAQRERGHILITGGCLFHYALTKSPIDLNRWLLLMTLWAREKGVVDLTERSRRRQAFFEMHRISNVVDPLVHAISTLQPSEQADRIQAGLAGLVARLRALARQERGEAKDSVVLSCEKACCSIVDKALWYLARSEGWLAKFDGSLVLKGFCEIEDFLRREVKFVEPTASKTDEVSFDDFLAMSTLLEMLKNAFWYGKPGSAVDIIFQLDEVGLKAVVRNDLLAGAEPTRLAAIGNALAAGNLPPPACGLGIQDICLMSKAQQLPHPSIRLDEGSVSFTAYVARRNP